MSAKQEHVKSLARDYLDTIDAIENGRFGSEQELRYLEGERAVLHEQLTRAIGRRRVNKNAMPDYARSLL